MASTVNNYFQLEQIKQNPQKLSTQATALSQFVSILFQFNHLLFSAYLCIGSFLSLSGQSPDLAPLSAVCYEVMSAKNYHLAPSPSGPQPRHLAAISQRNRRWPSNKRLRAAYADVQNVIHVRLDAETLQFNLISVG